MKPRMEFRKAALGIGARWAVVASLLAAAPAASTGQIQPEWSGVQSIEPGRKVAVRLYRDSARNDHRSVRGRFASATLNRMTALDESGRTVTVPQMSVRRVEVRRPLPKQPGAWALTAVIAIPLNVLAAAAQYVWEDSPRALVRSLPLSVGLT